MLANPRKFLTPLISLGSSHEVIALILLGSTLIPLPALTISPKYFVSLVANSHFRGSSLRPASDRQEKT